MTYAPVARIELAGGPVSWGVDFADEPGNPPYDEVLSGIAAAGLRWTELGPTGYLPAGRAALERHGLRSAGGFVFEPLHDPAARDRALGAARRAVAEQAAAQDVRAVFHPHAGSHVEFADEIERLLGDVSADVLGLCLDTGH